MSTHGVVHEWLIAEFFNLDFQRGKFIRDFPVQKSKHFVILTIINFATISKKSIDPYLPTDTVKTMTTSKVDSSLVDFVCLFVCNWGT